MSSFSDPQAVARYTEGPTKQVPGFLALQRMSMLLLAEHVPDDGRVLVLGAGGGLELKAFADAQPGWRFVGVDPSAPMLQLARETLGPLASRAELVEGTIDAAPDIAFDGATCLLTFHFLSVEERLHTLRALRRRLKPGGPLVTAHLSLPAEPDARRRWLKRYAAYAASNGTPRDDATRAAEAIEARLPVLAPEQEVALLHEAGFEDVELFYTGFAFKGWLARAPSR